MVRRSLEASPAEMAVEHVDSKDLEQCGARRRMRRRSASEEMLTRVEDGCWGEVVRGAIMVVLFLLLYLHVRDVFELGEAGERLLLICYRSGMGNEFERVPTCCLMRYNQGLEGWRSVGRNERANDHCGGSAPIHGSEVTGS